MVLEDANFKVALCSKKVNLSNGLLYMTSMAEIGKTVSQFLPNSLTSLYFLAKRDISGDIWTDG
jgi:hypothetical protein